MWRTAAPPGLRSSSVIGRARTGTVINDKAICQQPAANRHARNARSIMHVRFRMLPPEIVTVFVPQMILIILGLDALEMRIHGKASPYQQQVQHDNADIGQINIKVHDFLAFRE
jgi:hypothetical protein